MWGESQSCVDMKQAEKTPLLETWAISYEIGRLTQRIEAGAQKAESRGKHYFQRI